MDVSVSAAESQPTLWTSLAEAIRGSHQDYTSGSLNRAIFLLAVPMVLEMVLESLFAVVDVFWVGRLGANAVATVGLTESMLSLVFAVAMGLSLSTTAMVARRIGERDSTGAAVAAVQAIALGLMVSIVIGAPCLALAPRLLRWMGSSSEIVAVGSGYASICLGGSGVVLMLFLNNAIFRGAGDAAIAMRLLWVSNIINLFLDLVSFSALDRFRVWASRAPHGRRLLAVALELRTSSIACSVAPGASAFLLTRFVCTWM
jgi:Na+-driven multidrug efflux pump